MTCCIASFCNDILKIVAHKLKQDPVSILSEKNEKINQNNLHKINLRIIVSWHYFKKQLSIGLKPIDE